MYFCNAIGTNGCNELLACSGLTNYTRKPGVLHTLSVFLGAGMSIDFSAGFVCEMATIASSVKNKERRAIMA
jgi:hypothetical protein